MCYEVSVFWGIFFCLLHNGSKTSFAVYSEASENSPTKLSSIMMTEEDIQFAEKFKEWEIHDFSDSVYEADVNFENKAQVEVKDIALIQKITSGTDLELRNILVRTEPTKHS